MTEHMVSSRVDLRGELDRSRPVAPSERPAASRRLVALDEGARQLTRELEEGRACLVAGPREGLTTLVKELGLGGETPVVDLDQPVLSLWDVVHRVLAGEVVVLTAAGRNADTSALRVVAYLERESSAALARRLLLKAFEEVVWVDAAGVVEARGGLRIDESGVAAVELEPVGLDAGSSTGEEGVSLDLGPEEG